MHLWRSRAIVNVQENEMRSGGNWNIDVVDVDFEIGFENSEQYQS